MPRVLVTGGCGFVGANLVPMLRAQGHQVSILDNLSRGSLEFLDDPSLYTFHQGDITEPDTLDGPFDGQDVLIHLAAYGSVVESVADPRENFRINVGGTLNVLEAARRAGIRKVVFASTGGALIGDATPPVSETSVPRPISPYGASKLAGEGYCCAYANAYDMSITALRFANVVGPVSWHKKGAITAFFKAVMAGEPLQIFGDGEATRDFLYVEDLCRGITRAAVQQQPGFSVYHLASGQEVSIRRLAELARTAAGVPAHPIVHHPRRKGEVERNFATFALAQRELGFEPTVSIDEAMTRTWQWISQWAKRHP